MKLLKYIIDEFKLLYSRHYQESWKIKESRDSLVFQYYMYNEIVLRDDRNWYWLTN